MRTSAVLAASAQWRTQPIIHPEATLIARRGDTLVEYEEIRRTVIVAVFADRVLSERLVVKGGNALRLVYGIGSRTSLDVDFSTPGDLDEADTRERLERTLADRFDSEGLMMFDFDLTCRPDSPRDPAMTGCEANFKIIDKKLAQRFAGDHARLRREAATIGPAQQRVFVIQISFHELCEGAEDVEFDDFVVRAYTPAMIAIEKYRAICQQHPKYDPRPHKTPRARDFLDIHAILMARAIDLGSGPSRELFRAIFARKSVPLELLREIGEQREFHRADWASVQQSVRGAVQPFDFYFDFALARVPQL